MKEGGDIAAGEMKKETKGLLERKKIRDEGRTDMRGEDAKGIPSGTVRVIMNHDIGPVVENMQVALEDKLGLGIDGEMRNQTDSRVC